MKPFNPDFIPAVGDIDAFLKVVQVMVYYYVAIFPVWLLQQLETQRFV